MSLPAHFIDVRSCGAAGDGVTDDTIAIQTAINQLSQSPSPGMALIFPPGIYLVGTPGSGNNYLFVQNATDFEIRGYGATIKNANGESNSSVAYDTLRFFNCQRFKIQGLTIDGNKSNRGGANDNGPSVMTMNQCSDFVIRDCFLLNACLDTLFLYSHDGTNANGVLNGVIDGCILDGASRNAISIINAGKLKIVNNIIRNVSGTLFGPWNGIDMEPNQGSDVVPVDDDILVAHNLFYNCVGGAVQVNSTEQLAYIQIDGNEVINCPMMVTVDGWHCRVSNNLGYNIIKPATGPGSSNLAAILINPTSIGGSGATATAVLGGGVTSVSITNGGSGYSSSFAVTFTGGGGSGAAGTATASGGVVTSVTITSAGSGYTSPPTANFSAGGGTGAAGVGTLPVASVTITAGGSGYTQYAPPLVTFTGGPNQHGSGATGVATVSAGGAVTAVTITNGGSGYTTAPTVGFSGEQQILVDNNKIYNVGGGLHGIWIYGYMVGVCHVVGNQMKTVRGGAGIIADANNTFVIGNAIEDCTDSSPISTNGQYCTVIANKIRGVSTCAFAGIYVGGSYSLIKDNDVIDYGGTNGAIEADGSGGYNVIDGNCIRATALQSTWKSIALSANDVQGPGNYVAHMSENNALVPIALPASPSVSILSPVASKTANYTASAADETILANASTAAFTVTLPAASGNTGREYAVKKTDSSANHVTVATAGGNIDGAATYSLNAQYNVVEVVSDGSNWQIIATH
ncbi:MAG TPA: glycosyl hydrolase family 28-related protein [Tepidisphaeraceae bacterium]|jgi:hypothetical protein|nr:glycosyl hydrolase family 28-related protein [Tepidisphaeraceae bacterium]